MILTEQHIVKNNEWEVWCIKAKNLYNQSLYYWRQSIFKNIEYFTEYELLKLFREYKEETYVELPSHCGQLIINNLFKNIKAWQSARKEYSKNPSKFLGKPRIPKYKKEMSILFFNNFQVKHKNGYVHFPKMIGISPMKTKIPKESKLKFCRVVPKSNHFVIEFNYEIKECKQKEDNGKFMGVDLGLNNLATIVSNTGESFIINGKPLKSINSYYNKKKSNLQSKLPKDKYNSKRITRITEKRNLKVKNYIHHASKQIIEKAKQMDISKIIIGNNKNWKQGISIGKKSNQNFVSIPHSNLIETIEYKAKMAGIQVIITEESYTSKCSSLDFEPIKKHETYLGKRVKRGLFKSLNGTRINADANGSLNILRKVVGNSAYAVDSILSCVIQPSKVNIFKQKVCIN